MSLLGDRHNNKCERSMFNLLNLLSHEIFLDTFMFTVAEKQGTKGTIESKEIKMKTLSNLLCYITLIQQS